MPSFRFCRPDDLPLLAEAVNRCFAVHFPGQPYTTLADLRHEAKTLDLWASSAVLAHEEGKSIGVLIAARRDTASLILRLGVHPDNQGMEVGSHLVTSLKDKMAVLGPEWLATEFPEDQPGLKSFFAKLGFRKSAHFQDFCSTAHRNPPAHPELITQLSVADLSNRNLEPGSETTLPGEGTLAWERQTATLLNRKRDLDVFGVPDVDGIAAYIVSDRAETLGEPDEPMSIWGLGCREAGNAEVFLGMLLCHLYTTTRRPMLIPKLSSREVPLGVLEALGFQKGSRHMQYAVRCMP